ncbi:bifunctional DNA primase/polymerase [Sorangium sp. So ce128]|uniref:bifunctional DNA primase/polymerase n=1 Tax=Sorangium sp. So ce128 TaxID=3133281 RepID=UPI003F61E95C
MRVTAAAPHLRNDAPRAALSGRVARSACTHPPDVVGLEAVSALSLAEAAAEYARRGFRVIPLHSVGPVGACSCPRGAAHARHAGKHPRIKDWEREASSDVAKVRAWWERWPSANIGLAMGGPAALFAVDVDGPEGRATLAALEREHGPLPATFRTASGRDDGGHLLFAIPPELADLGAELANSVAKLPGIDVRAQGGQIVAPPSLHHTGRLYAVALVAPIASAPRWLLERLTTPKAPPARPQLTPATQEAAPRSTDARTRAAAYLRTMDPAISGQRGHDALWRAAVAMVCGFELAPDVALDLLRTEYNPRCLPPWSEAELRHKVEDAGHAGVPRGYLLHEAGHADRLRTSAALAIDPARDEGYEELERDAIVNEPQSIAAVLNELRGLPREKRSGAARAPGILRLAATLSEDSPDWTDLYEGLKVLGVGVLPWKRAVRAFRGRGHSASSSDAHPGETDERPVIVVTTAEHEVNDGAVQALASVPGVYQRGWMLVDIVRETASVPGLARAEGTRRIRTIPLPRLRELLTVAARWVVQRTDPQTGEITMRTAHPPDWSVRAVEARGQWEGIPRLTAIAECPVLRPDGSMLLVPGYDARTGILYAPVLDFPAIPHAPTRDQAREAADLLLDVVEDFPFESDVHRAAWLASVLTPLARFAFEGPAPMFVYSGNVRGAGKTLLAKVVGEIVTGRPMATMTQVDSEEEERKRITCIALEGDPLVLIDNISRPLGSGTLDKALTDVFWGERLLGSNNRPQLPMLATWYGTGNNVAFRGDTARRCCVIRLDSPLEKPETRDDMRQPHLLGHVREHRAKLVAAALTVLRAWTATGMDLHTLEPRMRSWGSFNEWSRVVCGAIVWLGYPDPGEARGSADDEDDPEATALEQLVDGWTKVCADISPDRNACTVAQVLDALQQDDADRAAVRMQHTPKPAKWPVLRAGLAELVSGVPAGKLPNVKQIGYLLRRYRNRNVGGRKLVQTNIVRGERLWTVVPVNRP